LGSYGRGGAGSPSPSAGQTGFAGVIVVEY
jgi:hypothetical protein